MAISQLFFRKGNFISNIELDIIIQEGANASVRLTENPVENGANMNDHIIVQPMNFFVSGVVSNISSTTIGAFSNAGNVFNQSSTKAKEAWDALLELQVNRTPFKLVQGLKEYNNIIILNLTETQDKDTSKALFFTATMKEVIIPGTQTITEDQFNDENISDKMIPAINGGLKQLQE